jgi:hypothetical protein
VPIVVSRIAFEDGVQVIGGMSKLLSAIKKLYPSDQKIITWSDNRLGAEQSYQKAGLTVIAVSNPDYCYVHEHSVHSKQSQKNKPGEKNEYQRCLSKGFYRFYDCGKTTFRL